MRRSGWLVFAALAAYAALLTLEFVAGPVRVFDESQQLVAAELVAQGRVPHRDFSSPDTTSPARRCLSASLRRCSASWPGRTVVTTL